MIAFAPIALVLLILAAVIVGLMLSKRLHFLPFVLVLLLGVLIGGGTPIGPAVVALVRTWGGSS